LSAHFQLAVESEIYPRTHRYPFPDLLGTTTKCRQIHAEASLLPFRLNDLRFQQFETIEPLTQYILPTQRAAIASVRLGLYAVLSAELLATLPACNLGVFWGLKGVIVEVKHWPEPLRNNSRWMVAFQQFYEKML
ncbi:hypothetical protein EJ02DRAFT_320714, partial [Clathrospora elynae]